MIRGARLALRVFLTLMLSLLLMGGTAAWLHDEIPDVFAVLAYCLFVCVAILAFAKRKRKWRLPDSF